MKPAETALLIDSHQLKQKLHNIQNLGGAHTPVISCYLDMHQGQQSCIHYMTRQLQQIFPQSSPNSDHAERMQLTQQALKRIIIDNWHAQANALVIFFSLAETGPEVEVLALATTLQNQLTVYTRANIAPLLALRDVSQNAILLSYINGIIQLFRRDLGVNRLIAWAVAPELSADTDFQNASVKSEKRHNRLRKILRSLLKSGKTLFIINDDPADIDNIKAWLLQKTANELNHHIVLPYNQDQSGLLTFIQHHFKVQQNIQSDNLANRLLSSLRFKGPARVGSVATLEALKNRDVDHLVLARDHLALINYRCEHCDTFINDQPSAENCSHCGTPHITPWNAAIEASWIAYNKNVPVALVESNDLQYIGGVGCLLRHEHKVMPYPVQHPTLNKGLDLVA